MMLNIEEIAQAMPRHELPVVESSKTSVPSGLSWMAKIPDIEVNLQLAQQWMNATSTLAANDVPDALVMVAGVKDAPKYYDCGLAMNTAWGAMARDPCSMKVWTSSDKMKEMVPECAKLRQGEKYTASYRALKLDQDTWCGGPHCRPACMAGVKCFRGFDFPFPPQCEGNRTVMVAKITEPEKPVNHGETAQLVLAVVVVILAVGLALKSRL